MPKRASLSVAENPHNSLRILREQAEERRQLVTQAPEQHSSDDLHRLVQELQIHQIELEMQYEELLMAQSEASAAQANYIDLYDFAPVNYFTLDASGTIEKLNLSAAQLLGATRQQLIGRRFALFLPTDYRIQFHHFLMDVLAARHMLSCELAILRPDGPVRFVQLQGTARPDAYGQFRCQLVVLDVDERRRNAMALSASEARFRRLFTDSSDAVVLLRGQQYIDCNDAALRLLGASHKEDIIGQSSTAHAPERQPNGQLTADLFRTTVLAALEAGSQRCEAQMFRLSGEEIWLEAVLTPIEDGVGEPLIHIIWRDVTERNRLAEETIRLRLRRQQEVLAAILSTQETERKRIAEALHNGVGQLLYAMKLSLVSQKKESPIPTESLDILNEAIRATRTISFELTPGILEDFGLRIALEELVKRIAPSHLRVQLHLVGLEKRLASSIEIAVYRIIQELINNVLKHAQAQEVTIHVVREGAQLEVSVEDDGIGFDQASLTDQPLAGIGLAGVRNRTALLDGVLAIQSRPGHGTIVSIELSI